VHYRLAAQRKDAIVDDRLGAGPGSDDSDVHRALLQLY
jgi:hypothetical protein